MAGFPLPTTTLDAAGLRPEQIARLGALIETHIADGRYPGCQIAIARHGKLAHFQTFGEAATGKKAKDDSLWLLFSNTKVVTAAALWVLAEQGAFRFVDRVSDHVPEFAQHGKQGITILQVMTHLGGYPRAETPSTVWADHKLMREVVCNYPLEFAPGSRLFYHGATAHWTAAVLIEAVTGRDFRDVIRETVTERLGLGDEIVVGMTSKKQLGRATDMHEPTEAGNVPVASNNSEAFRRAGVPGGGGYATARGMVAFYQAMLAGGELAGKRFVGPRVLDYAIRNWTGDMVDENMGMPMHRGIGPHLRGTTATIRGLGSFASPRTFGHGGAGNSYCWADPDSGVSFAYLTNCRIPDPWHSVRLDLVSNFVHSAIL